MPSAPIQALTRDGHYLPVINVTDPRFAVPDDPDSLRELLDASHDEERRNRRRPSARSWFSRYSAATPRFSTA
jgi:hypothetical protein